MSKKEVELRSAIQVLEDVGQKILNGDAEECETLLNELDQVQDFLRKESKNALYGATRDAAPLVDKSAAGETGMSLLHVACVGESPEIVNMVLARGPDLLKLDAKQRLALHCAAAKGSLDVVKALCW